MLESCRVQQMTMVSEEHFRGETVKGNKENDLHQCLLQRSSGRHLQQSHFIQGWSQTLSDSNVGELLEQINAVNSNKSPGPAFIHT